MGANRRVFTKYQKNEIWEKDRGICQLCYRKVKGPWEADHIYPFSLGGVTEVWNGQVTHQECNRRKYNNPEYSNVGRNRNWRYWTQ